MSVTDEIKSRIDIVELIGSVVPLKKAGRNFKGLCPFHTEKTPSFVVFPDSGAWRCFGACGEGGDIFTFVMKREGWDFPETLQYLADKAGVTLEAYSPRQQEDSDTRDRLRSLLTDAAQWFYRHLVESPEAEAARQYVGGRGLTWETVEAFQIGYAPDSWDASGGHLLALGYTAQEVIDAGMAVVKDDGGWYDRFRARLVIPIRDMRGQVVGFGARGLAPEATPKYINSPQSALFDKSGLLFGLDRARRTIRESEAAVIVEGYMDVMQAHQAGFTDVVAQMGTALTETQLRLLGRYASKLILALDPDTAGQIATERGREVIERVSKAAAQEAVADGVWNLDAAERDYHASLTPEFNAQGMVRYESRLGFDIRVMILPPGKDPDALIREDPQMWADLVAAALPVVEYAIRMVTAGQKLDDPKVKSGIAAQIVPLINDIANPVERSHYRQRLARLLKVDERALFPDSSAGEKPRAAGKGRGQRQSAPLPLPPAPELGLTPTAWRESFCLAALIRYPRLIYRANRVLAESLSFAIRSEGPLADSLIGQVTAADFAHPEHRMIFEAWCAALDQDEQEPLPYMDALLDPITGQRLRSWLDQPLYALERGIIPPDREIEPDRIYEAVIAALLDLRRRRLDALMQELQFVIGDMEQGGDSLTAQQYGDTIRTLATARSRIEQARIRYGLPAKQSQPGAIREPSR